MTVTLLFFFSSPAVAQDIPDDEEGPGTDDGGGGKWIKGYAMQQVFYTSGSQWSLTPFSFWVTYSTTYCCVKHNQCTACLKSEEENVCKYFKGL